MLPTAHTHTVTYCGHALSVGVRRTGDPANPAVVLLHALGNDSSSYEMQFEPLARSCHVLAWDAPGFGDSAPLPTEEIDPEAFCDVLAATLDALDLSAVCLVSSSFGSLPALQLAIKRPEQVGCLVLAAPSIGLGARAPEERRATYEQRRAMGDLPAAEFAARFVPLLVAQDAAPALVDRARRHGEVLRREGYLAALRIMMQTDGLALAQAVSQPVLLITGSGDQLTPPEAAAEPLSRVLKRSELRVIDGVGHSPHIEAPEHFNKEVAAFAQMHVAGDPVARKNP